MQPARSLAASHPLLGVAAVLLGAIAVAAAVSTQTEACLSGCRRLVEDHGKSLPHPGASATCWWSPGVSEIRPAQLRLISLSMTLQIAAVVVVKVVVVVGSSSCCSY